MSFVSKVNERRKSDKDFNQGIDALKDIKAIHKNTILELYMLAYDQREKSEDEYYRTTPREKQEMYLPNNLKGMESHEIKLLANLFSCFMPTNSNLFQPFKNSDRKDNLNEEIERFEALYGKGTPLNQLAFQKSGLSEEYNFDRKIDIALGKVFARYSAVLSREWSVEEGNFSKMLDKAIAGVGIRQNYLQLLPENVIELNNHEINTRQLCEKTDKLIEDLNKFKESKAGKAVLSFDYKRKFYPFSHNKPTR